MHSTELPPVTESHRQRAYVSLKIVSHDYDEAMADTKLRQLIDACAATLRKREWQTRNTKGVYIRQAAPRFIDHTQQD